MQTAKSIIKVTILLSLFGAAIFLILSKPATEDESWARIFFLSKAWGALLITGFARLYTLWRADPWISRYEEWSLRSTAQR